ncbi:hypothetical protein BCR37DRAFT_381140 [Protomyces lactucae-debilis]|uniref:Uncharacterized protein n=1 Tax=Protomyces lactucae-debilis TaxID=2754530 RepID=A0A1Y2FAU5_PROLT|nr:uncharacterized protein BCR37DRAFT_381140 [Protomyces lactucae-debilis]ORY80466.1 hypothetical protein BCR37DRAFT_381140 [Protomyces lactucae-debilis]
MPRGYPGTGSGAHSPVIKKENGAKPYKHSAHARAITATSSKRPQVYCVTELEWDERIPNCTQSDVKLLGCFSSIEKANSVVAEWHTRIYVKKSVAEFDQYQLMKDQGLCQLNVAVGRQTWQVAVEAVELDEEFTMSLLESNNPVQPNGTAQTTFDPPEYSSQDHKKKPSRPKAESVTPLLHSPHATFSSAKQAYEHGTPSKATTSIPTPASASRVGQTTLAKQSSAVKHNGVKRKSEAMRDGSVSPAKPAWIDTTMKPIPPLTSKKDTSAAPRPLGAPAAPAAPVATAATAATAPYKSAPSTLQKPQSEPKLLQRPPTGSTLSSLPPTPEPVRPMHAPFASASAAIRVSRASGSSDESEVDSDLERRRKKKIKRELQKLGVIVGQT